MRRMTAERRRPGRPVAGDSEALRRRILEVATRHFAAGGYARTTVKAIADEVGITSGAIYHYFPSKQHLIEVLSVQLINDAGTRLWSAAEQHAGLVDRVTAIIDELARVHDEQPELAEFTLVLTGDLARYPELRVTYESCLALYADLCKWLVDEAIAAGDLAPTVDRRSTVDMLHAAVTGITTMLSVVPGRRRPGLVENAKRLFIGTLFTEAKAVGR